MAAIPGADRIAAYWQSTLARLAAQPPAYKVVDLREPLPYRKFRVEYTSLGGVRVQALLAMPIRGGEQGRVPAIVTAPGYGGAQQGVMLDECQRGYAVLQVFPRAPEAGQERLTTGIDQPEGAYYQGVYADVIRGIDYLTTRDDVDPHRIALAGTSQGGGIALAVASLDHRVKIVVAHVPFLCHMRLAARTEGSLVRNVLESARLNDERHLAVLDYFDPLNLVANLQAPVLLSSGGRDTTCPAPTIQAVFERLPGVKSLFHDPGLTHTTSARFYRMTWLWLEQYLAP